MKCYFYPNRPIGHVINSILGNLGWEVVKDREEADIYFWWKFTSESEYLPHILRDKPCINSKCHTTLKTYVEQKFFESFNKTTFVDPLTYKGFAVIKKLENATHDCKKIKCPIPVRRFDVIYQRFLGGDEIINYRVPVIFGEVPYVLVQYKTEEFKGLFHGGVYKTLVKSAKQVFSEDWLEKLRVFCKNFVDIAELDIVDNCVIDVNNTPSAVTYIGWEYQDYCINECAKLLENAYGIKE